MNKILAVVAHPDDETILCGGTLALLARAGANVHVLCATRGEGGELGEPPLCERPELGRVREQEMRCAAQALGGTSVEFLDYIDPTVGENEELHPYTDDFDELMQRLRDYIQQLCPDAVITHGSNGEYGHPAHVLTHRAVIAAMPDGISLYTFSPSFPEHPRPRLANTDDPADLILDISAAFEQKAAAAYCHRTQNALFVRRSSKRAGRQLSVPEVLMKVEGLHRVIGLLDDRLVDVLEIYRLKVAG
ncbi:MAG: PIG-L family deacetylase [Chloroflexi bacterium]|nr:PIG-L family deacetylase [Chloroflexota bacterium]